MTDRQTIALRLGLLMSDPSRMARATRDRASGSTWKALAVWIHAIDPRCVSCGYETRLDAGRAHPRNAELGHLIAASLYGASSDRAGFMPGNIALMCHTCNTDAGKIDLSFTANMLIENAFVPQEWPAQTKPKAANSNEAMESRQARQW